MSRVGPCATGAVKAIRLVHREQRSGSGVQRTPAAGRRVIRREHWLADRFLLRFGRNGGRRLIAHNRTFVWYAAANADFDQIDLVSLRGAPSGGPRNDDISWWPPR